jgi:hypothetical protein
MNSISKPISEINVGGLGEEVCIYIIQLSKEKSTKYVALNEAHDRLRKHHSIVIRSPGQTR